MVLLVWLLRLVRPIIRFTFFNMHHMCCLNDNFLSNRAPRSFFQGHVSYLLVFHHPVPRSYYIFSYCDVIFGVPCVMCVGPCIFIELNFSCHLRDQSHSESTSFCNIRIGLPSCLNGLVSSAKILIELTMSSG